MSGSRYQDILIGADNGIEQNCIVKRRSFSDQPPDIGHLKRSARISQAAANMGGSRHSIQTSPVVEQRPCRDGGGGGAVFDAELDEHLFEMLVHGARADVEDFAGVAVRFSP